MASFMAKRIFSTGSGQKTLVELFYDIASPYTYFQYELLRRQKSNWPKMNLKFTPVTIAHIMKLSENRPPIMVPAKGQYMAKDLEMCSDFHQIPFALPDHFFPLVFEIGTLKTQRFLTAIQKHDDSIHDCLIGKFYSSFFTNKDSANITDLDVLKGLSLEAGAPEELISKAFKEMNSDEVKNMLKENTNRLAEMGGFGLPITLVHQTTNQTGPKWVFGSDRMHIIGHLLGESNPPILR